MAKTYSKETMRAVITESFGAAKVRILTRVASSTDNEHRLKMLDTLDAMKMAEQEINNIIDGDSNAR